MVKRLSISLLVLIGFAYFFLFPKHALAITCENVTVNGISASEAHPHPGDSVTVTGKILDNNSPVKNQSMYTNVFSNFVTEGIGEVCQQTDANGQLTITAPNSIPSLTEPKKYTIFIDNKASYMPFGCTSNSIPSSPSVCNIDFWAWPLGSTPTPTPAPQEFRCENLVLKGAKPGEPLHSGPFYAGEKLHLEGKTGEKNKEIFINTDFGNRDDPEFGCTKSSEDGTFAADAQKEILAKTIASGNDRMLYVREKSPIICGSIFTGTTPSSCRLPFRIEAGDYIPGQPSPTPTFAIPPTSTPLPTPSTYFIQCAGNSGQVQTSIPHPFPVSNSPPDSITFTFGNLLPGTYRMQADVGVGPWSTIRDCNDQEATAAQNYIQCKIVDRHAPGNKSVFQETHHFQLQQKVLDNYKADSVPAYQSCAWEPFQQSSCSLDMEFEDVPGKPTQTRIRVLGSGIPPVESTYQGQYFVQIFMDNQSDPIYKSNTYTDSFIYTKPTFSNPLPGDVPREHSYTFKLMYLGTPCTQFGKGCVLPQCLPIKRTAPKFGEKAPPKQTIGGQQTITPGKAIEICRPLCEQITDETTRNACKYPSWTLSIPGIGSGIDVPIWNIAPWEKEYSAAVDRFTSANKDKNYDVVKCISCFSSGKAYTALGCIETDIPGLIKRIFSIAIPIMGGILMLGIIYTAFMLIVSGGDPEKLGHIKEQFTSLILGALLFLGSVFIYGFLGGTILGIPGFTF